MDMLFISLRQKTLSNIKITLGWPVIKSEARVSFIGVSVHLSAEIMILSIKIHSDPTVKGINLFENELKLFQYGDDKNIFCTH